MLQKLSWVIKPKKLSEVFMKINAKMVRFLIILFVGVIFRSPSFAEERQRLLVAIEGGGAVQLDSQTGAILNRSLTGSNAFGALYNRDGSRAFVTDKAAGQLVEIDPITGEILETLEVGKEPHQPALTSWGLMLIPLNGEGTIAIVDVSSELTLLDKVSVGNGSKPHIVSLSPDEQHLYVTVQGMDSRVIAFDVTEEGLEMAKEFRDNIVPRVLSATNFGAFFTAHHSTGLHFADLETGSVKTVFMDEFGSSSPAAKQIEGVASSEDGDIVLYTHEGRQTLVSLRVNGDGEYDLDREFSLAANPYWVTLDPSDETAFVSIPGLGVVEAYDLTSSSSEPLWTTKVGGKPKRMALSQ